MARQFLGFGNGQDGDLVISSNTTDSPIDSSCSGTVGTKTLTVGSGLSFVPGQIVKIHQSRGTGAGSWEFNQVDSYSGTTLTLKYDLENTYTDSGASQAQVLVIKQYKSIKVNSGNTLTVKAWDGNVGGIYEVFCSGEVLVPGTISANGGNGGLTTNDGQAGGTGGGFRGGGVGLTGTARTGEGTAGDSVQSSLANGNGGGGADTGGDGGGAGGGNGTAGSNGSNGAVGGSIDGLADLSLLVFGGGGGGGHNDFQPDGAGGGGSGGGIIGIFAKKLTVTGSIRANGGQGYDHTVVGRDQADGGSGAGGSILIKTQQAVVGSNLITATSGPGSNAGGQGGSGRVRIETCVLSGNTNPSASQIVGGHKWCGSGTFVQ